MIVCLYSCLSYPACKLHLRRIMLSSVACLPVPYFSTSSHKRHFFGKNVIEQKMCVFIFSTILSETFLILRRIQRDIIINVHRSSVKYPLFLSDFNETWTFPTDFRQIHKCQISWIRPVGAELFHLDRQRDRRTDMKLIVAFRNFAKLPKKGILPFSGV
jgi:hypothetical protein